MKEGLFGYCSKNNIVSYKKYVSDNTLTKEFEYKYKYDTHKFPIERQTVNTYYSINYEYY